MLSTPLWVPKTRDAVWDPYRRLYGSQLSSVFFMQNRDFSTRLTSLHRSQTSSVVLSTLNSVLSTRTKRLYGFQPSSVVLYVKRATLGLGLQVCMGPRPHLWFWALITACLAQDYIGSRPHLWFCACKTASLGLELQVSVGPRPHLWFLHAKQRLLDQNNKSQCFPDMTCHFVHVQEHA